MFFKRKPQLPSHKEVLYNQMQEALQNYSQTYQDYINIQNTHFDSATPSVLLTAQELEVYRYTYYYLRVQYESQYGNVDDYQKKLDYFYKWREGMNLQWVQQKPFDHFTSMLVLARGRSAMNRLQQEFHEHNSQRSELI